MVRKQKLGELTQIFQRRGFNEASMVSAASSYKDDLILQTVEAVSTDERAREGIDSYKKWFLGRRTARM